MKPSALNPSTIGRRCAATRYSHKLAGLEPPTDAEPVKATVRGIRRKVGVAPKRKSPATADLVLAMAALTGSDLKGLRDRALLLLGFAGAFRRSELVALNVEDLRETESGLLVTIRQSKTDQEGKGQTIAIVRGSRACPAQAVMTWLGASAIISGPVFRPVAKGGRGGAKRLSDMPVARTVKALAERMRLQVPEFGGHSLRAVSSLVPPLAEQAYLRWPISRATSAWLCAAMCAAPSYFMTMLGRDCSDVLTFCGAQRNGSLLFCAFRLSILLEQAPRSVFQYCGYVLKRYRPLTRSDA